MMTSQEVRVGYVVHTYPLVSHTFVQREVSGLRAAGASVATFSVHRALSEDILSAADEAEAAQTTAILPVSLAALISAHVRALARSPKAYVETLLYAQRVSPPGLRSHIWQVFYFAEAVLLWRRCKGLGIRHLHGHLANVATDLAWLATEFARREDGDSDHRWSFTMHGPTEFNAVDRYNLARKVRAADLVVCISDFCRSQLMALVSEEHWSKLVVVHCGSDLERYRPLDSVAEAQAAASGGLRILCVGRLVPEKGQALLLQAIAALRDEGLDVRATLVGGGPDGERLAGLARRLGIDGLVNFTGPLGQDDVPGFMADSDVLCLPSFSEGLPVVLMEAMAAGVPVVTTRITGVPELVEDGVSGLLVSPGRADTLAAALRRLALDEALRSRLGNAGREKVEQEFNALANAADLERHFARLQDVTGCRPARSDGLAYLPANHDRLPLLQGSLTGAETSGPHSGDRADHGR